MSWGIRITVLYVGFMTLILSLVFISSKNKEELEAKDYYRQELDYQNKIDAIKNANGLVTPITYNVAGKIISISLPNELLTPGTSAEVYLFRPSDAAKDKRIKFSPPSNGKIEINDNSLVTGVYKMKITITSNGKSYIKEEVINIS